MNQIVMIELLNIAQKHRSHLESRGKKLALTMPLTEGRIASFTEQDIVLWDAWINRFCQLQDHMGMKLFDAFISFVGQDPLNTAFAQMDILFNVLDAIAERIKF